MQSPNSQRSSESSEQSPRPSDKKDEQVEQQPMTNQHELPLGMNPQEVYVSPYWVLAVFSIIGVLFLAFIIGVVSLLTVGTAPSTQQVSINKTNTSQLLSLISKTPQQSHNLAINDNQPQIKLKQQNDMISQFIKTHNIGNQPNDVYFAKYLLANADKLSNASSKQSQYQYAYYSKMYGSYIKQDQLPMCIVATGRNNMGEYRQQRFIQSIQRLNYSNYQFVYVDDASTDQTVAYTKMRIQESIKLKNRSRVIEQKQITHALANKIRGISLCSDRDIVVDVDADDSFIGISVLHVLNHLYTTNPYLWAIYTSHLVSREGKISKANNRGLTRSQFTNYKTLNDVWVTSHLKTYRKLLFNKIDIGQWRKDDGGFCNWASDRYIMYAILQLAGPEHTQFQNILPYLYDYTATSEDIRNFQLIKPDKLRSQTLTPYQQLNSLDDEAKKIEGYSVPAQIKQHYRRAKQKQQKLLKQSSIPN